MNINSKQIQSLVKLALFEDLANQKGDFSDVSSVGLEDKFAIAEVISREKAMLCGQEFANEILDQVDTNLKATWYKNETDLLKPDEVFLKIEGEVKSILRAERSLLNFLQFLCSIATKTNHYKQILTGLNTQILDTRKTIPTLRAMQKYATEVAGAQNHRFGLFDAILLKENHISAAGGITKAVRLVKKIHPELFFEIEVENLDQLKEVLNLVKEHSIDRILLDNFSIEEIKKAVKLAQKICPLEVSGSIKENNLRAIAETGVEYISIGALTKNIKAIDLSLSIVE